MTTVRRTIVAFICLFSALFAVSQDADTLSGRLEIDHPGFESHRFAESYIYIFELNTYIEVSPEGTFAADGLPPGSYAIKTYVPGFEASYRTAHLPDQRNVVIPIKLQMIALDAVVVKAEVPAYLKGTRDLLNSPQIIEGATPPPRTPEVPDNEGPTINLNKVFGSILNLFRRDRDKND